MVAAFCACRLSRKRRRAQVDKFKIQTSSNLSVALAGHLGLLTSSQSSKHKVCLSAHTQIVAPENVRFYAAPQDRSS